MKVYLAAAWGRRLEIVAVAERLRELGVEVTSRWLTEEANMSMDSDSFAAERAAIDLADVDAADTLVRFTDALSEQSVDSRLVSCARMVEFGYAKKAGKRLYVCGGHQNVFDYLPEVIHVKDVYELYIRLFNDAWFFDSGNLTLEEAYE